MWDVGTPILSHFKLLVFSWFGGEVDCRIIFKFANDLLIEAIQGGAGRVLLVFPMGETKGNRGKQITSVRSDGAKFDQILFFILRTNETRPSHLRKPSCMKQTTLGGRTSSTAA